MASETTGEIQDVEILKPGAVACENNLQASHIGTLRLREFVDVLFQEDNALLLVNGDPCLVVGEAAQIVHAARAEQFGQERYQA